MTLRVIDIVDGTIVDGPGLRTSIYLAGCRHACPGCHNPQSWDFNAGTDVDIERLLHHIREAGLDVTITGGDPLYQMPALLDLVDGIHKAGHDVWCYTGFTYEEILVSPVLRPVLFAVDVLVDGRYDDSRRDISLRFRGSSNQRIIDLHKSHGDKITLWQDLPDSDIWP